MKHLIHATAVVISVGIGVVSFGGVAHRGPNRSDAALRLCRRCHVDHGELHQRRVVVG